MKTFTEEKGFTLVETIVAMGILVICVFAFTTLFASSYAGIFNAGHKSEKLFEAQHIVESKVTNPVGAEVVNDSITLTIDGASTNVISGKKISASKTYGQHGNAVNIKLFVPDN